MKTPGHRRPSSCALAVPVAALVLVGCTDLSPIPSVPWTASAPTLTPLAPLEPTPVPQASALPLTEPGCCARPWWSDDGSQVLFVDDPPGDQPLGVYAVSMDGREPQLASVSISNGGLSPPDGSVPRLPDSARNVQTSPNGDKVAWSQGSTEPTNVDRRQWSLWVVELQGVAAVRVLTVIGGDLIGWAGDGAALVLSGRPSQGGPSGVWRVPLDGGAPLLLAPGERPRSAALSPSAGWVAFYLAFEEDPSRNGVWAVRTSGEGAQSLPGLASYRWGREGHLLYIPYNFDRTDLSLLELDLASGESRALIDGTAFPGGIASNDWAASPMGDRVVYRSATDGRLWVVFLGGI